MSPALPEFDSHDVHFLISAVEKALQELRAANERLGGNDAELLEYGRRYAMILQKLTTVAHQ